jgi:predicted DNA-binding protein (MmcQ/YjbR family)
MDIFTLREYCLGKKGTSEDTPFGEDVLVFRVLGKIFVMTRPDVVPPRVNLKCEPELAIELRERYEAVQPGYHTSKKHWNTVTFDGSIPDREVRQMIDHSYEQVVKGMKKAERQALAEL